MGIIKAAKLFYDYVSRDEHDEIEEVIHAVSGVDLDVEAGQFIAILGHNGSGKSTLAKQMNALLVPTGGTLWVKEMDTSQPENVWKVRQTAGMVFQNPDNQIIASLVEEDVGFGPENLGVPTEDIWKRVTQSLKAVGMMEQSSFSEPSIRRPKAEGCDCRRYGDGTGVHCPGRADGHVGPKRT